METFTGLMAFVLGAAFALPLEWRRRKRDRRERFRRNLRLALGACPTCDRTLLG